MVKNYSARGIFATGSTVAVMKGENVVGHVPKKISVCSLYLRRGRSIFCRLTGFRRLLLRRFSKGGTGNPMRADF